MKNQKSTRRALVTSALSLVLCLSMLIGTTFAWFTDSVTSANNKIQSGNLDVDLYMWTAADASVEITDESDPIFGAGALAQDKNDETLWEPGKTQVAYLSIKNNGSLDLKYKVAINVKNPADGKDLYKVMEYAITPNATYGAVNAWNAEEGVSVVPGINATTSNDVFLGANQEHFFALSVHMLEEAGNEYQNGKVEFDICVLAGQVASEADSFGIDYDANAAYPVMAWGSQPIVDRNEDLTLDIINANGGKMGSAEVPHEAYDDDASKVDVKINKTFVDPTVTITSDKEATTYNIDVTGIKSGNTEPIKVEFYVGAGLTNVKFYHKNVELDPTLYSYNAVDGVMTFLSASFSPYTLVYDKVPVSPEEEKPDTTVPKAIVTDANEYENVALAWTGWGGFNPGNSEQQLDSVYLFEAKDTAESVKTNKYRDWYCDYYVTLVTDKMSVLPEGSITLGGNYGGYGWVGFDNPEVNTNEAIPLLGSVMSGTGDSSADSGWTYSDVVNFVTKFWCGVGLTEAGAANANLDGAKFVVQLRLTNPEDTSEIINVNTVTYTFGSGASVIE